MFDCDRTGNYEKLFQDTKFNAARRGINFVMSMEDFLDIAERQNGFCAVTDMEFDFRPTYDGKKRPFYPSIDRIDSGKGYSKKNVRIVVAIANFAMNEWGSGPLFEMVDAIIAARERKIEQEKKEKEVREKLGEQFEERDRYLNRLEAAEYMNKLGIKISKLTLQKYATVGGGPVYRKFGHRVVYLISDLNAWVFEKMSQPMASSSLA